MTEPQEVITTDTIITALRGWVEEKQPISPEVWLDGALKLTVLLGDEAGKLFGLQQQVANLRYMEIELGASVAKARAKVEATDLYKAMKTQEAKIKYAEEMIRVCKQMARNSFGEFQAQR